jgi:hypothetical protein
VTPLPVSIWLPSGETATASTGFVCTRNRPIYGPVAASTAGWCRFQQALSSYFSETPQIHMQKMQKLRDG